MSVMQFNSSRMWKETAAKQRDGEPVGGQPGLAVLSDVVCGGQFCHHQLLPPPKRHETPQLDYGEQALARRPSNQPTKSEIRTGSLVFRNVTQSLLTCVCVSVTSEIHNDMDCSRHCLYCDNGRILLYFLVSKANVFCTIYSLNNPINQELLFMIVFFVIMIISDYVDYSLFKLFLPGNKPVSVREKVMYNCYFFKGSFSLLKFFFYHEYITEYSNSEAKLRVLYTLVVYNFVKYLYVLCIFIKAYLIIIKSVYLILLSTIFFHTNTT